jgi:hypothetical protein
MEDPTTIALNLTFFGTLGVALVMFVGLFFVFVATLVIAGLGRLVAVTVMALFGRRPAKLAAVRPMLPVQRETAHDDDPLLALAPAGSADGVHSRLDGVKTLLAPAHLRGLFRAALVRGPLSGVTRREPPAMSGDWAAAVARADARAAARAAAGAAPEVKVSVRDLPSPDAPVEEVTEVAPLVESATDHHAAVRPIPRSFGKPAGPGPLAMLDTGSLVSLAAHAAVMKGQLPAERRRAG